MVNAVDHLDIFFIFTRKETNKTLNFKCRAVLAGRVQVLLAMNKFIMSTLKTTALHWQLVFAQGTKISYISGLKSC